MNKSDISQLKNKLGQIRNKKIEVKNIGSFLQQNQVPKYSKVHNIDATLMFVDLRNSTDMTDSVGRKNMVKVYKMYTTLVEDAASSFNGKILQIVGDGILCGFTSDNQMKSGMKAVSCAISIHTYIKECMNPLLEDSLKIKCGVGIRSGHVYISRLIVDDVNNEVAYPSSITNYASKLCGEANHTGIIFDDKTYGQLSSNLKKICVNHKSEWGSFKKIEGRTWKIE